eukprot:TRINITY_DN5591_c0_g1_i1.p1 TRINITY_DN5591_c0_g1~~TRINITY_DN5591_c0_g1_i1.p1  ORF type:complete len:418 (+),score=41.99 TRINITY_DN5591_c0_g1_i1:256-1509(+)
MSSQLSFKNPFLLVALGLFGGIIVSNIVHSEYNASKKLLRRSPLDQQENRELTSNSNNVRIQNAFTIDRFDANADVFNFINSTSNRIEIPSSEIDRPAEDLNEDEAVQSKKLTSELVSDESKPFLFIFIGIISGRQNQEQRQAVRDSWSNDCQSLEAVKCQFILSNHSQSLFNNQTKVNDSLTLENEEYGDMVFLNAEEGYTNLAYKTLELFQYVTKYYNVSFLLKTDDDAFVFPDRLYNYLLKFCPSTVCPEERLFIGSERRGSEVVLKASDPHGDKWENYEFYKHTGVGTYLPYMLGGGYILSGPVLDVLVYTYEKTGLIFTKMEDASVGLWLGGMDVRRIDDSRSFVTMGVNCCFSRTRQVKHPVLGFYRLLADICRTNPKRVILHAVKNVTQMRYLGDVYRDRCKLKPATQID